MQPSRCPKFTDQHRTQIPASPPTSKEAHGINGARNRTTSVQRHSTGPQGEEVHERVGGGSRQRWPLDSPRLLSVDLRLPSADTECQNKARHTPLPPQVTLERQATCYPRRQVHASCPSTKGARLGDTQPQQTTFIDMAKVHPPPQ